MRFRDSLRPGALAALVILCAGALPAADWHHLHLTSTDPKAAVEWYAKHMEGTTAKFGQSDMAVFGKTIVLFFKKEAGFGPSQGTAVDHIGFSFTDLDAKMKEFEAAGIKIVAPARALGKIKFGFIEDPWGTKIEVMQDPDLYGFHHVHLHSPDPQATLEWYSKAFGGEITRYGGFLPAIKYNDMWLICQKYNEEKAPTKGRAVDHIGFSFPDLDAAAKTLKEQGVNFTLEPRPYGALKIAFIDGPQGVNIELVQPAAPASGQ
jgi:predicted enzyme related to lactoylglutathione lyase